MAITTPEPSLESNSSDPCCGAAIEVGESDRLTKDGPLLPFVDPAWTPVCGSGGSVPSASSPADTEDWDPN
jgi:hypothetical protein